MNIGSNSSAQLKSIIERAVRLEEEKKTITVDLKELYLEAKSNGFEPAALKALVKEQLEEDSKKAKREEREAIIETYRNALAGLADLPLGKAALDELAEWTA